MKVYHVLVAALLIPFGAAFADEGPASEAARAAFESGTPDVSALANEIDGDNNHVGVNEQNGDNNQVGVNEQNGDNNQAGVNEQDGPNNNGGDDQHGGTQGNSGNDGNTPGTQHP